MAIARTGIADFEVGSLSLVPAGRDGGAEPGGTLHLVDGWEPLCGGQRVRFVFPGRVVEADKACPECTAATMPRQRASAAPRATARTRTRAS